MRKYPAVLRFALLAALLACARADTLTLRSGATVQGSWVGIDGRQISFSVNGQIQTYPRADVSKVTFNQEPGLAESPQSSDPPAVHQPKIELGMTKDQVAAILGKPDALLAEVGTKQIYSYKDSKVTFVDGKVADIQ